MTDAQEEVATRKLSEVLNSIAPSLEQTTDVFHRQRPVAPNGDVVSTILNERQQRYGTFAANASLAQSLKAVIGDHAAHCGANLDPDMREALDQICTKIARIVTGDPRYSDSWVDVAGFARLIADRLNGVNRG